MDKYTFINIAINLLSEGRTTEIPAYGISMFPILLPGDVLTIHPETYYQTGDIVVFKGASTLIAHRIIKIKDSTITCKGDSMIATDQPLKQSAILGKVIARNRKGKYRSVNHWTFRLAKRIMPHSGKYPTLIIRFLSLVYLKLTKN